MKKAWFTNEVGRYPGGGYLRVNAEVGDLIDAYNVQVGLQQDRDLSSDTDRPFA